jgi:mannosyl-oligosaccharide alpha-1,2-mannosidase
MWRTTGDLKWREHGWAIWEAIEKKTRTPSGYASVHYVDQSDPHKIDSMPRCASVPSISSALVVTAGSYVELMARHSYFLSETIKYAYLLFTDEDPLPTDKFVFNTEAHPLPIFKWRDWASGKPEKYLIWTN